MRFTHWAPLLSFLLPACAVAQRADTTLVAAAKYAVARQLKDPSSAQFRDIVERKDGIVCGEFNAKNAMGGYAGFRPFVYNYFPSYVKIEVSGAEASVWCTENAPRARLALLSNQLAMWSKACEKSGQRSVNSGGCSEAAELRQALEARRRLVQMERAELAESQTLWGRICENAGERERKASCQKSVDARMALQSHKDKYGE